MRAHTLLEGRILRSVLWIVYKFPRCAVCTIPLSTQCICGMSVGRHDRKGWGPSHSMSIQVLSFGFSTRRPRSLENQGTSPSSKCGSCLGRAPRAGAWKAPVSKKLTYNLKYNSALKHERRMMKKRMMRLLDERIRMGKGSIRMLKTF